MNRYLKVECRYYTQTKAWRSCIILSHNHVESIFWISGENDSKEEAELAAYSYIDSNKDSNKFDYKFPACLLNYSGYN